MILNATVNSVDVSTREHTTVTADVSTVEHTATSTTNISTYVDPCVSLPPILCDPILLKYNVIPRDDPEMIEAINFGMHIGSWSVIHEYGHINYVIVINNTAASYWYRKLYTPGEIRKICVPVVLFSGTYITFSCWNMSLEHEQFLIERHTFRYQFELYKKDIIIGFVLNVVIMLFGIFGKQTQFP